VDVPGFVEIQSAVVEGVGQAVQCAQHGELRTAKAAVALARAGRSVCTQLASGGLRRATQECAGEAVAAAALELIA
jgi:hypothetical protein